MTEVNRLKDLGMKDPTNMAAAISESSQHNTTLRIPDNMLE